MKAILQFLFLFLISLCINSCAVNEFSRQKYTNFGHTRNLHLKSIQDKITLPEGTKANQVGVTLPPERSELFTDSIQKETIDTQGELITTTLKVRSAKQKQFLVNTESRSHDVTQKIRKFCQEKKVDANSSKGPTVLGILSVILAGLGLKYARSKRKTSDEKNSRLRKWLKTGLLLTLGLGVLAGLLLIVGVFLMDLFVSIAMLSGALALLSLVLSLAIFICYKIRTKGKRVWEKKSVIIEDMDKLDKHSRIFSWLGYTFLVLFCASLAPVILFVAYILPAAMLIGLAIFFLVLAVLKGRKYKQLCVASNVEYPRKAKNRQMLNSILIWFFGVIAILSGGFLMLVMFML